METKKETNNHKGLSYEYLCTAEFEVGGGLFTVGASPFGEQRVGYISGGRFFGPRLNGKILAGGGNWSRAGKLRDGRHVGTFDARTMWQTDDGAMISIIYHGRSALGDDVRAEFADPASPSVDPARYYLRIAPVFETSDPAYDWLNGVLAIGVGERTAFGVRHQIYEVL